MKICLLTRSGAPFGEWIRSEAMVVELRASGNLVEVAYIPKTKNNLGPLLHPGFWLFFFQETGRFLRRIGPFWSYVGWKYWLNFVLGSWVLLPQFRKGKYDLVQAEAHGAGLCAWILRHHVNFSLYTDYHGIAEEFLDISPQAHRFGHGMERLLLEDSDGGICVSGTMQDYFAGLHGCSTDHLVVSHCGTDKQEGRAIYALPFKVIYAGGFSYFEKVLDYVEAARLNTDPEIEFYLLGGGEHEAEILDHIQHYSINLHWFGRKPRLETLDFLKTMQVGVAPSTTDAVRQVASPIKVVDYASCGLPVVTVEVGEWSHIFREYQAGVVCAQSDPKQFLQALQFLKNPQQWQKAADNALRLVSEARLWNITLAPVSCAYRNLQKSQTTSRLTPVYPGTN